tara:strand:+ start:5564 stop:6355 length:792 start_codon:yes stop_codon:yes gene_type:complete
MSNAIHASAIVDPAAQLGSDVEIGPFCIVGPNAVLGDRVRLMSNVTVDGHTHIGADTQVYPYAVLGMPPQDFKYKGGPTRLIIGERNIIREHCTMHPGTEVGRGETRVGDDGFFMVGVHIAHDCIVGDHVALANHVAVAGYAVIGDHVISGGHTGVTQFTRIGRHAFLGGMALANADVIPYGFVTRNPAHLEGLNLVGLKRRGFARDVIREMRTAYRLLFAEEGTFQERISDVSQLYPENAPVREIIEFIQSDETKKLCMPHE